MSIDAVAVAAPEPVQADSNGHSAEHNEGSLKVESQQGTVQGQEQDLDLHRACAGGNVDEVRGVLSRGLENLETLGEHVSAR